MSLSVPEIVTLGCRLNIAESEAIAALAGGRDIVVVNSCAVTNAAVKQTRVTIRRLRRARPSAELVVTGCASQIDPTGFAAMPEVDRVVGNLDKLAPRHWGDLPSANPQRTRHARAFVAVQTGCDHSCTFCAIPAGRGPSRSLPIDTLVEQIAALTSLGQQEVVLTGVDVTSYGADLPGTPALGHLVETVLARTAIPRVRLSSLDAVEIDPMLFALVTQDSRIMPHLHLSLQAGDDMILKRMKRRHLRSDAIRLVERLKARRDIAIGADLIAGFPTETDAMAANSLALIADCDIVHAHIFPYSAREGTPAARMPQVAGDIAKARAARLRQAAATRKAAWLGTLVGTVQDIVVERPGTTGHTRGFAEVCMSHPRAVGSLARIRIDAATPDHLIGSAP